VLGYPVAWFIARSREKHRDRLLLLVMIPFWTSFLIRTYAWITILKSEGLLNGLLLATHAIAAPFEMLYTPGAVVVGLVYAYLPFMILPIYGSAEKVQPEVIEAAQDLGCSPWRTFFSVVLPLTRPGFYAGVLMVFVPSIGMFAITDLMGGARVPMIGNVIQDQFVGQARDKPFGAALGVIFLLLFVVIYGWLQRRGAHAEEARV
jgi:spermidine/putrescine transport system permease protein